jgi:hypothetical protein
MSTPEFTREDDGETRALNRGASALQEFLDVFGEGGITEQDRAHMQKLVDRGGHENKVSRRLCAEIRRKRHCGQGSPDVAEEIPFEISTSSVVYHAGGRCQHYTDIPAVTGNGRVTQILCGVMRQARWQGLPPKAIAWAVPCEIDRGSVSYHTIGDCTHETDVPPFSRRTVSASDCRDWRARVGDETMGEIARRTPWSYTTVASHVEGHCNHDHETDSESESVSAGVGREQCRAWRRIVREQLRDPEGVAEDGGFDEELVRRHVTGACEHGFDIIEEMPLRYNGMEWVPLEDLLGVDG